MASLSVYDPPMCCSSGVCGPSVDKALVRFSADLGWLKQQGVAVERFTLSQQPGEFVKNPTVKQAIDAAGSACLPLVLVDGREVCRGRYPTRQELAGFLGIADQEAASLYTPAVAELVALGAAIAANCKFCLKYHYDRALELGVSIEDITQALDAAQRVKDLAARQISDQADRYLAREGGGSAAACCSPETSNASKSKCC